MAESNEHSGNENPPEISDEAIRRFLFGRLSAEEQVAFEEQLIGDDQLEGRVRRGEFDLTDDYAFERLSEDERELFEQRFLVSNGRQQILRTSSALRDHFATASHVTQTVSLRSQPTPSIGERLRHLVTFKQPAWRLSFGLAILSLLVGTIWIIARKPRIREQLITQGQKLIPRRRSAAPAAPGSNQQESHHPVKASPTPLPQESPAAAALVETVILSPQNAYDRDQIRTVRLREGEPDLLRLQLTFGTNQPGTYRAELLTISGQSVFLEPSLNTSTTGDSIEFGIPFRFLSAGDYEIKLSRIPDGTEAGVVTYYFRAQ